MSDPYKDVNKKDRGYSDQFFTDHFPGAAVAMKEFLSVLLESDLYSEGWPIYSAVDFGCGLGPMLKVLEDHGTEVTVGVDGWWINQDDVVVNDFRELDINKPVDLRRRFGLVICLEVAEHLPEESAEILVEILVTHGSRILFSGAVPGQGGRGHVNEQWPDYWAELFVLHGYRPLDFIRDQIWERPDVPFWYIQNTLMFVDECKLKDLGLSGSVVHNFKSLRRLHSKCNVKVLPNG